MNDKFYSQSLHFSSRFSGTNLKLQFLLWRGYVWVIVGINRKLWSLNTVLARGEVQASLLPYVQRDSLLRHVLFFKAEHIWMAVSLMFLTNSLGVEMEQFVVEGYVTTSLWPLAVNLWGHMKQRSLFIDSEWSLEKLTAVTFASSDGGCCFHMSGLNRIEKVKSYGSNVVEIVSYT